MRACTTRYANKIENDVSMIFPITLRAEYLNSFCNHLKGYVHHKRFAAKPYGSRFVPHSLSTRGVISAVRRVRWHL
jgi:hypothetical protein